MYVHVFTVVQLFLFFLKGRSFLSCGLWCPWATDNDIIPAVASHETMKVKGMYPYTNYSDPMVESPPQVLRWVGISCFFVFRDF